MRRSTGMLLLPTLLLLACSDTPPTANPMDELTLSSAIDNPCPTCAFGPRKFARQQGVDRIRVTFVPHTAPIDNCTLEVEDDGVLTTSVQIWLNGAIVVERSALLGPPSVLQVPVTLLGSNTIEVAVRGGTGHFVKARIECGTRVTIAPDPAVLSPEKTQQFSVSGVPGPYTWSVNGTDGGNSTFGTISTAGLYRAPITVPTPASFPVCVRVTSTPTVSDCAAVTIVTAKMVISSGDGQVAQAGSPVLIPPAVLVTRADGSPWPGVGVTFAVASGGGSVTGATPTTGADGIATVGSWTLGESPGPNTLTATAAESGITGNPVTFTAQGSAALRGNTITAGGYHTCGIAADGKAYCWGYNVFGQIGDGSVANRYEPTAVSGGLSFVSLTGGTYHTCGLASGGVAYCWGNDIDDKTRHTPTPVGGSLTFTTLTAGRDYTCGLVADGAAYCWGQNLVGNLGDGTENPRSIPTPVVGGLKFATLAAHDNHTCGVAVGGVAYCWGWNGDGQLGDGTRSTRPVPTLVHSSETFQGLALGEDFTCGISSAGVAYCWGLNDRGQLGDGTFIGEFLPVQVHGGLIFTSLVAGDFHTCGLITGGVAYCWGDGASGQLGAGGGPRNETVPTAVVGGLTFRELTGGRAHTCGVASAGALYCWGWNIFGQLGDGTTSDRYVPTAVIGGN